MHSSRGVGLSTLGANCVVEFRIQEWDVGAIAAEACEFGRVMASTKLIGRGKTELHVLSSRRMLTQHGGCHVFLGCCAGASGSLFNSRLDCGVGRDAPEAKVNESFGKGVVKGANAEQEIEVHRGVEQLGGESGIEVGAQLSLVDAALE